MTDLKERLSAGEKTLAVLSAALDHSRFSDIVAATGLPKATVHRVLATLIATNFIAGDGERGYGAGPALLSLSGRALSSVDITDVAAPIVDRLVAEVDCTVHVGVATDSEIVYLIRRDASKPYQMKSRVGHGMPLHCTGMGKAVIASWPEERVAELASRVGLPARTPQTITTLDALRAELARVRARGFATDLGENEFGTVCVSAGIRDHTGAVTHGLSISSIELEHPGTSIEQFADAAIAAAAEISRLVGSPA
ncbi:IclR family transcriptional regulator [Microbacterium paludicola]|uniref:IclR family transcriptional regulator n=1 Tax=Microbacterium paludicola TaxID=300019 RepID=A0A4Y9FSG7_9MICO|nr:IclR family transcriptional regulator [Microbacterium paludicola]MBF0817121.1 IclR family transcriptional regulator [Microbacterium paludicola]TFU32183.1 IclR family transcriptional regulator [Microbacterium paludicola]